MTLPQLQFLNLPQIDASIQQQKAAELQNALAPYLLQKTQMDVEKGGLEMQKFREDLARQKTIRDELAAQYAARSLTSPAAQSASPSQQAPASYAGPDNPMSPRVAGPDWMPKQVAQPIQQVQAAAAQELDSRAKRAAMLRSQAEIYAKNGDVTTANALEDQAIKLEPKWSTDPRYDQNGNAFLVNEQGGTKMLNGVKARDKIVADDLGGTRRLRTEYSTTPIAELAKTMTPGEIASNRIAQGNLNVAQQRLALDQVTPQYMQTEQGIVALPKKLPNGQAPVGVAVTGPDGTSLGPKLKEIPASVNTAIISNMQNLNRAKTALDLVSGKSVGEAAGDENATGWKGYLPNSLLNRVDSAGTDARAAVADLGSMVLHDRSGAAVTAAESPRLMPFIPLATDDNATVKKKLSRFIDIYKQETDAMANTYSKDQGYKPNPILEQSKSASTTPSGRIETNAMPSPSQYVGATVTDTSSGIKYKSDGKNWVRQ